MTENIIQFKPRKKVEVVEIQNEDETREKSLEFAYEILDYLHDTLHRETGDCIYTDTDYTKLGIFATEVISAIYLLSQGRDHTLQEVAEELFKDIDIEELIDNMDKNDNDEEV